MKQYDEAVDWAVHFQKSVEEMKNTIYIPTSEIERWESESIRPNAPEKREAKIELYGCRHPEIKEYYGSHSVLQFRYCVVCDHKFKE